MDRLDKLPLTPQKRSPGTLADTYNPNPTAMDPWLSGVEACRPQVALLLCRVCRAPLQTAPLQHYDHDDGIGLPGVSQSQWVYVACPRCGCGHSWNKWRRAMPTEATRELNVPVRDLKQK